ncbi:T9SS type A sorting domain-containing protein [Siphonobacter aquaeclarae]|uniref:Por secretion system C-terminal sorting domain-containing protein n=1 Tax=Siphonobacter aquaeclarae TaxID=563176 RepID=A0A1G9T6Q2_9BACT|nr:T9SS type A sorting domain-containing protein [Siphonobacter aquaeclarae]SDM43316.1 Por secretion system C-terminal sorting domain-containing protein [Siphonobacter aquaeclarae]
MKHTYFRLLLPVLFCFSALTAYASFLPDSSKNAEVAWDWTACCSGHTMYASRNGEKPTKLTAVQLPFYSSGHWLVEAYSNEQKDMWPEDGWILAYKDFGTAEKAPPFPFFVLYNRYKGTFRVMVYNARAVLASYFRLTLSFSQSPAALFTFTEKRGRYQSLESYDSGARQMVVTQASQGQGWICGDFLMTGYVPDLASGSTLRLDVDAVGQWYAGQGDPAWERTLSGAGAGGSLPDDDFPAAIRNGYKSFSSPDAVSSFLGRTDMYSTLEKWLSIGDAAGIDYLISGQDGFSGYQPVSFKNQPPLVVLGAQIVPLASYRFALGTDTRPDAYPLLQPVSWGIFNVKNTLDWISSRQTRTQFCPQKDKQITDNYTARRLPAIELAVNPDIPMTLISSQAAVVYPTGSPAFFDLARVPETDFSYRGYDNCLGKEVDTKALGVGLRLEFEIRPPLKSYGKRITFYKTYYSQSEDGIFTGNYPEFNAFPNPTPSGTTFTFPRTETGAIRIYDLRGNLINTYTGTDLRQGRLDWPGTTPDGNRCPAGTYVVRFEDGHGNTASRRLVKIP